VVTVGVAVTVAVIVAVAVRVGVAVVVAVAVTVAVAVEVELAVGVALTVGVGRNEPFAEPVNLTLAVALPAVASLVIPMLAEKSAPCFAGANSTVTVIGSFG
jgi:hypothetical protein